MDIDQFLVNFSTPLILDGKLAGYGTSRVATRVF